MMDIEFERWFAKLCADAGRDKQQTGEIREKLEVSPGVLREIHTYYETGNFLCEYRVAGYTLVDIMVWQMDHFKAWLDRGDAMIKGNGSRMILEAVITMLAMERDPESFVNKMQQETGTDYPGKY